MMTERGKVWVGSVMFLLAAPGVVAGLVPWWISGWRLHDGPARWGLVPVGLLTAAAGVAFLVHAFVEFAARGLGTPAPVAPTKHLVVSGAYRYVRNPMYLAVTAIVLGQAIAFTDLNLVWYAAAVFATFAAFVYAYEEPTLVRTYGDDYRRYRAAVPGWIPRSTPYRPDR